MELSSISTKQFATFLVVFVIGGLSTGGALLGSGYIIHEDNSGYTIKDNPEMEIIYELEKFEDIAPRIFNNDIIERFTMDRMDDQVIPIHCPEGENIMCQAIDKDSNTQVFEHNYLLENAESYNGFIHFKDFQVAVPNEISGFIDVDNSYIEISGINEYDDRTKFRWHYSESETESDDYYKSFTFDASLMHYSEFYVSNDVRVPNWTENTMIVTEKGIDIVFTQHIQFYNTVEPIQAIQNNEELEITTTFSNYLVEQGYYSSQSDRFRVLVEVVEQ